MTSSGSPYSTGAALVAKIRADAAGARGADRVHHLHRLDDQQRLAFLDQVADLDERRRAGLGEQVDGADHGRGDRARMRRPRVPARPRRPLRGAAAAAAAGAVLDILDRGRRPAWRRGCACRPGRSRSRSGRCGPAARPAARYRRCRCRPWALSAYGPGLRRHAGLAAGWPSVAARMELREEETGAVGPAQRRWRTAPGASHGRASSGPFVSRRGLGWRAPRQHRCRDGAGSRPRSDRLIAQRTASRNAASRSPSAHSGAGVDHEAAAYRAAQEVRRQAPAPALSGDLRGHPLQQRRVQVAGQPVPDRRAALGGARGRIRCRSAARRAG